MFVLGRALAMVSGHVRRLVEIAVTSRRAAHDPDSADRIRALQSAESRSPGWCSKSETLISPIAKVDSRADAVHEMGVRLVIDDFGTATPPTYRRRLT